MSATEEAMNRLSAARDAVEAAAREGYVPFHVWIECFAAHKAHELAQDMEFAEKMRRSYEEHMQKTAS